MNVHIIATAVYLLHAALTEPAPAPHCEGPQHWAYIPENNIFACTSIEGYENER